MAEVSKTLKDAAYVAVGLGVIGFQKAQVRRQELRKDLAVQVDEYGTKLRQLAGRVEPVVAELQQRIEPVLDELQGQAKGLVQQARSALTTSPAA